MRLLDYMDKGLIFLDLNAEDKDEALSHLAKKLERDQVVVNGVQLLEEIRKRENQGSTSIGNGVAIPHARLKKLDKVVVIMARLSTPIPFGPDGHDPVGLIFMLLTSTEKAGEYLRVLAKLSKILKEKTFTKRIAAAESPEQVWRIFESLENQDI